MKFVTLDIDLYQMSLSVFAASDLSLPRNWAVQKQVTPGTAERHQCKIPGNHMVSGSGILTLNGSMVRISLKTIIRDIGLYYWKPIAGQG